MTSDLIRWLDSVTDVFPHDTAARLRRELEAHAEEMAQTLHAEGHLDAEAAALHALGDAREVRRRLEETHFTRAEVEWLRQDSATRRVLERGFYPGGWQRFFSILVAVFVLLLPLIDLRFGGTFSWTNALIYWGLTVMAVLVERFAINRFSRLAAAILWRALGILSIPFWLVLTKLLFRAPYEDGVMILFQTVVCCVTLYFMRPRAAFALLPKALRNAT